jgi:elongation factor G
MSQPLSSDSIRNVVLLGHAGTGKSTLLEAILFCSGKIPKRGTLEEGSLVSDFDDEEKKRKMSVHCAMSSVVRDGITINILDVPGTTDFVGEARAAVQAADAAILVVDAVDGVQIGTEKSWQYLNANGIPRILFVNKMDKERASYQSIIDNLESSFSAHLVSLCVPIGEGESLEGVVDIIDEVSLRQKENGSCETVRGDVPAGLKDHVHEQRGKLIERAAEGDDELVSMFLDGKDFDESLIHRGIEEQMIANRLHPVICGSALKLAGVNELLSVIADCVPSSSMKGKVPAFDVSGAQPKETEIPIRKDAPASAVIFKTYIDQYTGRMSYLRVASGELLPDMTLLNTSTGQYEKIGRLYKASGREIREVQRISCGDIGVLVKLEKSFTGNTLCDPKKPVRIDMIRLPQPTFAYAIYAENRKDEDKLAQVLGRLSEQSPTLRYEFRPETHQTVLCGMGELQLEIALEEVLLKYRIPVRKELPRVAYRETINVKAEGHYKHKKQSGGHGQYGEVYMRIEPLPRGSGFRFGESIVGGAIPRQYIPGIEKGVREAMNGGVVAGYPVVDVLVDVYDGTFHDVDSSELAFKIAGLHAFKDAMAKGRPQLLEPVMNITIYADKQYLGGIMSDITSRRGKVLGMTSRDESSDEGISIVKAQAPLSELLKYSIDLKSMTSNKATFEMSFSHYDPVNGRIADQVIEQKKKFAEEIATA